MSTDVIYVAIYARVSTDLDSQKLSVEHQVQMLTELARIRGEREGTKWVVLPEHIYEDEDVSGSKVSIMERPAFKRMVEAVKAKQVQVVMFKGVSRFSRDQEDGVSMYNTLVGRYRVRLISEEENFDSDVMGKDGRFWFGFHTLMAQFEADKISTRVSLGTRQKVKNGKWGSNTPPYGYDIEKETFKLVPNEKRHAIETIFDLYLKGMGMRAIAEHMTHETPYDTPRGGKTWSATMISRILHNKAYIGTIEWNKTNAIVAPDENGVKKLVRHHNEEDQIIVIEDAHEPIIDKEVFARVQEKTAKFANNKSLTQTKHPLSGLLRCGRCGSAVVCIGNVQDVGTPFKNSRNGKTYHRRTPLDRRRYACVVQHQAGKKSCDMPYIKAVDLEELFYYKLMDNLEAYRQAVKEGIEHEVKNDSRQQAFESRLKEIDKEIAKTNKALADMVKDRDLFDPETYRSIILGYNEDIKRLKQEHETLKKEVVTESESEAKEALIEKLIDEAFEARYEDRTELRDLFQLWFEKIIIHDKGKYEVFPTVHGLGIVK